MAGGIGDMKGNSSKVKKQFIMHAVPYTRSGGRGKSDVTKSGALALFSSRSLALDYSDGDGTVDEESIVKVRVTIELFMSRTNGNGS
jgi:hypothetical protein